jgi:CspA family cold shock protein
MYSGTIKFFNQKSKFGFVKCNEDGKEYYVHAKDVEAGVTLETDDKVSFELKEAKRGPEAVNVKKI